MKKQCVKITELGSKGITVETPEDIFFCDECGKRIGKSYYSCCNCEGHFHNSCLIHHIFLYSTEEYQSAICAGSGYYDVPHYGSFCPSCMAERQKKKE